MDERPLIMGILNVTPDSFSDGGLFSDSSHAVDHALEMINDGADIIDVGGESTRPGADSVSSEDELGRVVPVIREICRQSDVLVSVDSMKAGVAAEAISAGASIINDVSAMTADPGMPGIAAESGAGVILMHMQGNPRTMQSDPTYDSVAEDVSAYLLDRVEQLLALGLKRETMAIDPGIGFGKTVEHNVALLTNLAVLTAYELPVVVGLSRKSFLGKLAGRDVDSRLASSLGALVYCILNGAHVMRVHDVRASVDAARVAMALAGRNW